MNFDVQIKVDQPELMDAAVGQAESTFRVVRDLDPLDETDFNIEKSDNIANILLENIKDIEYNQFFSYKGKDNKY